MWKPLMLIWFLPQGYIEANLQILEFGAEVTFVIKKFVV